MSSSSQRVPADSSRASDPPLLAASEAHTTALTPGLHTRYQPTAMSASMPPPRAMPAHLAVPYHRQPHQHSGTPPPRPHSSSMPAYPHMHRAAHSHSHSHSISQSHNPTLAPDFMRQQQQQLPAPPHHRPYDLQSTAPASRTFWNHYETGLLVRIWLELEPQFTANKRNAGVWTQLAQRLTEQSGRNRTVRECRIKWKNMWAKHRDLANAKHMSPEAKLREFPFFTDFSAIRRRGALQESLSSQPPQPQPSHREGSAEIQVTLSDDGGYASPSAPPASQSPYSMPAAPSMRTEYEHGDSGSGYTQSTLHMVVDGWPHRDYRAAPTPIQASTSAFARPLLAASLLPPQQQQQQQQQHSYDGRAYGSAVPSGLARQAPLTSIMSDSPAHGVRYSHTAALQNLLAPVNEEPVCSQQQPAMTAMRDIAGLMRRLDRSAAELSSPGATGSDDYDDGCSSTGGLDRGFDAKREDASVDSMVECMRALASTASLAEVAGAVQQIMGYVERESRRRDAQSERHHRVVAALAAILAQSAASSTAASRRSSHAEWSPSQARDLAQGQDGCNTSPPPPSDHR